MSYWQAGDKITLPQTDVKISAEGPTNFTENNVIGIYIPPSIKFFSGKDCLLEFDVLLKGSDVHRAQRLMLDSQIGANSLFSMCRVYAGNRATLLEETDEYATLVGLKYSYDANDSKRQSRALTEGCGAYTPDGRGSFGTQKSTQNNVVNNPYMTSPNLLVDNATDITAAPDFIKCKVSLQIHMGVFANNTKAFPNMLTDGCFLELTCAPNRGVFRMVDGTAKNRLPSLNPQFSSRDGLGSQIQVGAPFSEFYTTTTNSQLDQAHSPFVVGEEITFYDWKNGTEVAMTNGMYVRKIIKNGAGLVGYEVGDTAGNTATSPQIIPVATAAGGVAATSDNWFLISKSNHVNLPGEVGAWNPTYTISDVNLIVRRIDMGAQYESGMVSRMKEGGVIMFDIPSVQCHKQSILAGDVQATISLPINHQKARSIINVPTDAAIYTAQKNTDGDGTYLISNDTRNSNYYSDRSGISGIGNNLSEYSYLLEGRIVPSRPISTAKSSGSVGIDANHMIELEKALQSAGIVPLSFQDYRSNFCIGRALTLDRNTIFDGRGKDCRLNVKYEGVAPSKDTLWKSYVFHIRTLSIKGNDISVMV
tara:strand:+ start:3556 stop:5325 length:1770 start_codon:yes stop_codon:yes gene_type:complete